MKLFDEKLFDEKLFDEKINQISNFLIMMVSWATK